MVQTESYKPQAPQFELTNIDDWADFVFEQGWTDGFPVFPPTPRRVGAILEYLGRDPQENLGTVAPGGCVATVEGVAINCAMAGCKPEYVPVVLTILEALLDPRFHLLNAQASTVGGPPFVAVSGPVVKQLGFNYAEGTYGGSGHRANGTVARAVRLILWNIGQGKPGQMAKAIFGTPSRWGSLIAERPRDDGNPWEEFHVTAGLASEDSAVSVLDSNGSYVFSIFARLGGDVTRNLPYLAEQIKRRGSGGGVCILGVNPDMANMLANQGWTKEGFRDALYEHCWSTVAEIREAEEATGGIDSAPTTAHHWTRRVPASSNATDRVYSFIDPDHLIILVAGGVGGGHVCHKWGGGGHSADGFGLVTKKIDWEW